MIFRTVAALTVAVGHLRYTANLPLSDFPAAAATGSGWFVWRRPVAALSFTCVLATPKAMAVSEAALKENYRRFSDEKLMRIASEDATKLRPEALALLKEELGTRGLADVAEKSIQAQLRVASAAEITEYCGLLQVQPCPLCYSSAQALNATLVSKALSMLVLTIQEKKFAIACPTCLDKLHRDASNISVLLGWWGFPWGVVRTLQTLSSNRKMAKINHESSPSDLLKAFVASNLGRIEAVRNSPEGLQALIRAAYVG